MELQIDRWVLRFAYRYEVVLGAAFIVLMFWPMFAGLQGFMGAFSVMLVLLHARSTSQYKRGTEDETPVDKFLSGLPLRYELLVLVAVVLWLLWWFAAGTTGFMMGLGIVALALLARSSSQLKRGSAETPGL